MTVKISPEGADDGNSLVENIQNILLVSAADIREQAFSALCWHKPISQTKTSESKPFPHKMSARTQSGSAHLITIKTVRKQLQRTAKVCLKQADKAITPWIQILVRKTSKENLDRRHLCFTS